MDKKKLLAMLQKRKAMKGGPSTVPPAPMGNQMPPMTPMTPGVPPMMGK